MNSKKNSLEKIIKPISFLETVKMAKRLVHSLSKEKLSNFKQDLMAKVDYLKKQTLFSESKEACEDLARQASRLYTNICFEQKLAFQPKKRGPKGKELCSEAEQNNDSKERKERHYLKGIETHKQLESAMQKLEDDHGLKVVTPRLIHDTKIKSPRGVYCGNYEWYTPPEILEKIRFCFDGQIDLDPCSNPTAQKNVQATTYYTKQDDGLAKDWSGKLFMNPPYSAPLVRAFVFKLLDSPQVTSWITLTNNSTETQWCKTLWQSMDFVIFPSFRLGFLDTTNNPSASGAIQGQMLCFKGVPKEKAQAVFSKEKYQLLNPD